MNLDKSDVKVGAANEIGCRLDDMLESQTKDLYRHEGMVTAFRAGALAVENLEKLIDAEMDEGKVELETAVLLKRWVARARHVLTNLSQQADNNRIMQTGKISAMESAVAATKKFKEEEMARAATLRVALQAKQAAGDHVVADEIGRPGMTIKEQRLAEEPTPEAPKNGMSQHKVEDLQKMPATPDPVVVSVAKKVVKPKAKKSVKR